MLRVLIAAIVLCPSLLASQSASGFAGVYYIPYFQTADGRFTGFALSNYRGQATTVQFRAYGPDGNLLAFPTNPSSFDLEPGRQLALVADEIFGPSAGPVSGWLEVTSDRSPVGAVFLTGTAVSLDGAVGLTDQSRQLIFTRVHEGPASFRGTESTTHLSIVNPNDSPITFLATLFASAAPGQPIQQFSPPVSRIVAAKGCVSATVSQLFGLSDPVVEGHVRVEVTEGAGAVGFELIELPESLIGLNASLFDSLVPEVYSAQLASSAEVFTNVKLVNTAADTRTLRLFAVGDGGNTLSGPAQFIFQPFGSLEMDGAQIFGFGPEGAVASLRVEADGPGVVGDVLFGDPLSLGWAAGLPLQPGNAGGLVFSQVTNTPDVFTGVAFYNPAPEPAEVTVQVYSAEGLFTGGKTLALDAGERLSKLLAELVPETAGQVRGYIIVRSTSPVVTQELFGNSTLDFLAAVPPTMEAITPPVTMPSPYAPWTYGPPSDPGYFPIGVWLQTPSRASQYKDLGINIYVGLFNALDSTQLNQLAASQMPVITFQNQAGLAWPGKNDIQGWLQQDEPDNAQPNGQGGYGPCVSPSELIQKYQSLKSRDASRPVLLNFGQGVAFVNWVGRGSCTGDTAYYSLAADAADILSFDIYPVTNSNPTVAGKLEFVATGVANLINWSGGRKPVWNFIETTHINNAAARPTPDQIKAEVWMSLIHGSKGIVYFVHEWQPSFREDGIFRYPEIVAGVRDINGQIASLAPVLNSPSIEGRVLVESELPVATMVKVFKGDLYLFAVRMRNSPAAAHFKVTLAPDATIEAIGENRSLDLVGGRFTDSFSAYQVHLYKIPGAGANQ